VSSIEGRRRKDSSVGRSKWGQRIQKVKWGQRRQKVKVKWEQSGGSMELGVDIIHSGE